jgi:putative ABC transport system ATP-binding protein
MSTPTASQPPSAKFDSVTKHYPGGVEALREVSVQFASGEQVAIVGPSGSGKTTLLTILGTLERATAGTVKIAGLDIDRSGDRALAGLRAHHIGFVFQSFHLQESLSALDNVATGMLYGGTRLRERRGLARQALEQVGLGHRVDHRPGEMSGGERQRVAIARALAKRPTLILADEPTGNLDSRSGAEVLDILHGLAATGSTLVLITHDKEVAATFPRRLHMCDGAVVRDES